MRRFGVLAMLASLAVTSAGCMGGDDDSTARKAAIGSSAPTSTSEAAISSPDILSGAKIKISGWNWGVESTSAISTASGAGGAGKAAPERFQVTKNIDGASTRLFTLLHTSGLMKSLVFTVNDATTKAGVTYTFTNLYVVKIQQAGANAAGDAMEEVQFVYAKMRMDNVVGPTTSACWDYAANTSTC